MKKTGTIGSTAIIPANTEEKKEKGKSKTSRASHVNMMW